MFSGAVRIACRVSKRKRAENALYSERDAPGRTSPECGTVAVRAVATVSKSRVLRIVLTLNYL